MVFDYSKLTGKIVEKFGNRYKLAKMLGISNQALSNKLNNKTLFTSIEIVKIVELFKLDDNEVAGFIRECFFTLKVEKVQQSDIL